MSICSCICPEVSELVEEEEDDVDQTESPETFQNEKLFQQHPVKDVKMMLCVRTDLGM